MKFSEVIGQQKAKERLRTLVDENRVPNALLLCGPQGCGKLALAMAFASYLLGEKDCEGSELSEHEARQIAMLRKWEHPDLHFTYPTIKLKSMSSEHQPVSSDFASQWHELISSGAYFTINDWMEAMNAENQQAIITGAESDELSKKLSLKSSQGGYKVSIIWMPERMNLTSANKLLKILEEPPQQTVFVMVSEEPEKLLETIRSRTQRIDIPRIDTEALSNSLQQLRGIEAETAMRIARLSNGSWTKALEELDAGSENKFFLDMFIILMRRAYERKIGDLKKWTDNIASLGREKQRRMLSYFMHMIRESFMYNFHIPELTYMTEEEENFTRRFAPFINEANVIEIQELLGRCHRDIGQNANPKIVFFDLSLKMIMLLIKKD
ncbi:MAG: DNA polymerase III subunit delta [Prevotella sp.]|nr:DNA polymerase III subunit delta [Prevotella sp.]